MGAYLFSALSFSHLYSSPAALLQLNKTGIIQKSQELEGEDPLAEGGEQLASKQGDPPALPKKSKKTDYVAFLEAKCAYFRPTDSKIRHLYAQGMPLGGIEASVKVCRFLYPWVSASYLSQVGHTANYHSRTQVQLVPIGFGLKRGGRLEGPKILCRGGSTSFLCSF